MFIVCNSTTLENTSPFTHERRLGKHGASTQLSAMQSWEWTGEELVCGQIWSTFLRCTVYVCIHVCSCLCRYMFVCMYVRIWMWRPKGSLRCCSLGIIHPVCMFACLWKSLSVAWNSPSNLSWLVGKPQRSAHFCPFSAGITSMHQQIWWRTILISTFKKQRQERSL